MGWKKCNSSDETQRARYHSKETGPMEKQRGRDGAAPDQHGISTGAGRARRESSGVSEIADQDQPHHALRHGPACNKRRCMTDGASSALWCAAGGRCTPRCMRMRIRRSIVGIRRLVPILPIMPRANLRIHVARPTEKGVPDGFPSQKGRPAKPQRDGSWAHIAMFDEPCK